MKRTNEKELQHRHGKFPYRLMLEFFFYLFYFLCRIADDSGGITDDYGVIRNVFCYDGTCTDYDVISDVHTRKDDAVTTEPDIVTDGDGLAAYIICYPGFGIHWMTDGVETGLWSHQTVITDGDRCCIQHDTLEIGEEIFADMDMKTIIAVKWWFDKNIIVAVAE